MSRHLTLLADLRTRIEAIEKLERDLVRARPEADRLGVGAAAIDVASGRLASARAALEQAEEEVEVDDGILDVGAGRRIFGLSGA